MADQCEFCANFVSDDEFGDYCNINLDEDEMARFLTRSTDTCHYFQLYDEYKIVRKQNKISYTVVTFASNLIKCRLLLL